MILGERACALPTTHSERAQAMKNLFQSFLIAVALLLVPAMASAQVCHFVASQARVLKTPDQAKAEGYLRHLEKLSAYSRDTGINTHKFAKLSAIQMVQQKKVDQIVPECRDEAKMAEGFLLVNGLSGTMTEAEFFERVRTTGFILPASANVTPTAPSAPLVAAPAPVPVASAPLPPAAVNYQPQIDKLQKQLDALKARPVDSLSASEKTQLNNLPSRLKEFKAAQAAAEAARKKAEEEAGKAATQAGLAATSAKNAATSEEKAAQSAKEAARDRQESEKAAKAAKESSDRAAKSENGAKDWSNKDWFLLAIAVAALLLSGLGFWSHRRRKESIATLTKKVDDATSSASSAMNTAQEAVRLIQNVSDQVGVEDRVDFDSAHYNLLKNAAEGEEKTVPVLVNGEVRHRIRFLRVPGGYHCLHEVDDHNRGDLIKDPLRFVRKAYRDNRLAGFKVVPTEAG